MGIHPNGNPDHIMGHGIWLTLYVYICFPPIWYGIQPTLATSTSTSTSSSAAFHTTHQTHSVLSAGLGWLVQPGEDLWGPMGCFIYIIIYIYSTYWHGLQPSLAQFLGGSTDSLVGPGEDLWGRRQRHPFASFWWGWTGPNRIFNHPGWMVRWVGTVGGTRGFPRKQRETYKKDLQGMDRWRCGFLKKISR